MEGVVSKPPILLPVRLSNDPFRKIFEAHVTRVWSRLAARAGELHELGESGSLGHGGGGGVLPGGRLDLRGGDGGLLVVVGQPGDLGQLARQQRPDGRLDLPGGDGAPLVVVRPAGDLGQVARQQRPDGGLDLPGHGDGRPLVVVCQAGGLGRDALKDVADGAVHDGSGRGAAGQEQEEEEGNPAAAAGVVAAAVPAVRGHRSLNLSSLSYGFETLL